MRPVAREVADGGVSTVVREASSGVVVRTAKRGMGGMRPAVREAAGDGSGSQLAGNAVRGPVVRMAGKGRAV